MPVRESFFVGPVAFLAEYGCLFIQQGSGLCRRVGIMTVEAPLFLFYGVMLEFSLPDKIRQVLVTFKTEFIPLLYENKLIVRRMGVMAAYTLALYDDFMNAARLFRNYILMTFGAEHIYIVIQQFSPGGRVRIVAARTFSFLEGRMHIRTLECFLKGLMTSYADL
jgi:hypothetical protein